MLCVVNKLPSGQEHSSRNVEGEVNTPRNHQTSVRVDYCVYKRSEDGRWLLMCDQSWTHSGNVHTIFSVLQVTHVQTADPKEVPM